LKGEKIAVMTLTGTVVHLEIAADATVLQFKTDLQRLSGIPGDQQQLLFAGRLLEDDRTLEDYGIEPGAVVHMALGGAEPSLLQELRICDPSSCPKHLVFSPFCCCNYNAVEKEPVQLGASTRMYKDVFFGEAVEDVGDWTQGDPTDGDGW
jgi:hypothetical protein